MKLHALMSLELDERLLEEYRLEVEKKEGPDVTEEESLFPGPPEEWSSMLDVVDLVNVGVIVRSELLDVRPADEEALARMVRPRAYPWTPDGFDRWTAAGFALGILIVIALALAFTDDVLRWAS